MGKWPKLSLLHFSHLKNVVNSVHMSGLCEDLNTPFHVCHIEPRNSNRNINSKCSSVLIFIIDFQCLCLVFSQWIIKSLGFQVNRLRLKYCVYLCHLMTSKEASSLTSKHRHDSFYIPGCDKSYSRPLLWMLLSRHHSTNENPSLLLLAQSSRPSVTMASTL